MKCPIDGNELQMTERQGVEIDYCPQCRGIWLDRGELDKIIERSAATNALQEPPERSSRAHYDGRRDDDYNESYKGEYEKPKRRKSFLDDLFDF